MPGQDEAKILVKKADGTFVHVTLSELKKLKRSSASSVTAQSTKPASPWVDGKLQTTTEAKKSEVRTSEPMKPEAIKPVLEPVKKEEVKSTPAIVMAAPSASEVKKDEVKTVPAPVSVVKKEETKPAVPQVAVKKDEVKPTVVQVAVSKVEVPNNLPAIVKPGEVQKISETKSVTKPEEKKIPVPVPPAVKAEVKAAVVPKPVTPPTLSVGKEDMRSLLEEPAPGGNKNMPLTSETREKQVDAIIQSLTFRPAAGNNSRLRTIIQLFLKDVRGEAETREILRRPEIEGGMGLSVAQTEEVINKSRTTQIKVAAAAPAPEPLKPVMPAVPKPPKFDPIESARLEKELPIVRPIEPVKFSGADKTNVPAQKPPAPQKTESSKESVIAQATKISMNTAVEEPFKISSGSVRTTMQDVKAPPLEVGPVDEIRYFSLVDFRRLSTNPLEAATRLGQKFINLKEESIVLYFEALEAWTNSPLYRDYLQVVSDSLLKRTPLQRVTAGDTKRIQLPEIKALVLMEKQLG